MGLLAHTTETVALHNAGETFTLARTYDVNVWGVVEQLDGYHVSKVVLFIKCELGQVSLWCCAGLLEVSHQRMARVLLWFLLETHLNCVVAIFLDTFDLSDNTRTYFDNSAWNVLSIDTEHGCHSDFLS